MGKSLFTPSVSPGSHAAHAHEQDTVNHMNSLRNAPQLRVQYTRENTRFRAYRIRYLELYMGEAAGAFLYMSCRA
jgi:hypothetical protein